MSFDWRGLGVLVVFVAAVLGALGLFGCTYCAKGAKDPKCYVVPDACYDEVDAGVR